MFTNAIQNTSNWLQQKDHGSVDTRPVSARFSFGSRSLLVRSSFVSRSSLVAYSLVYRRPIENRTRIERISNERRTKEDRENDGKPSKTWRETVQFWWECPLCFSSFSFWAESNISVCSVCSVDVFSCFARNLGGNLWEKSMAYGQKSIIIGI